MRRAFLIQLALMWLLPFSALADDELITLPSKHSAQTTVQRLQEAIIRKGWTIFSTVDQAALTADFGVKIPARTTIVFASMEAWVRYIIDSPTVAIEMPHRLLVWEDIDGVWVTRNTIKYYMRQTLGRHEVRISSLRAQQFDEEIALVIDRATN